MKTDGSSSMNTSRKHSHRIQGLVRDPEKIMVIILMIMIFCITALYRWYQPITHPALLQFDVFDWARQSREWLTDGHLVTPTTLWVFPIFNALVAKIFSLSLFQVYLFGGAVLTTFNLVIIYGIGALLWQQRFLRLMPLVFYAFNTQLLARSVNYLPETMSYTFGLAMVFFYLKLFRSRKAWWFLPIGVLNYFFYFLHQSGLNFLMFTGLVLIVYIVFLIRRSWRWRVLLMAGASGLAAAYVLSNTAIKAQFAFFLNGTKNVDIAFQGTAIPYIQIFSEYSMIFYSALILGAAAIIARLLRHRDRTLDASWAIILIITLFYYSFLYLLPNLKLYSLVPWRFYTWFSLYAIFIVGYGMEILYSFFKRKTIPMAVIVLMIILNLAHASLISDNMYTADEPTLQSIESTRLPQSSIVITTNANYLQTRYALVGQKVTTYQADAELFRATDAKRAHTLLQQRYSSDSVYVLISRFQLKQRPTAIDYWRNSAIYDMNLDLFMDQKYFINVYQDQNIYVFRSLAVQRPKVL